MGMAYATFGIAYVIWGTVYIIYVIWRIPCVISFSGGSRTHHAVLV